MEMASSITSVEVLVSASRRVGGSYSRVERSPPGGEERGVANPGGGGVGGRARGGGGMVPRGGVWGGGNLFGPPPPLKAPPARLYDRIQPHRHVNSGNGGRGKHPRQER